MNRKSIKNFSRKKMTESPYHILGVAQDASLYDIKRAYRRLAHIHHPDKKTGRASHELFQKITEAYQMLGGRASGRLHPARETRAESSEDSFRWRQRQSSSDKDDDDEEDESFSFGPRKRGRDIIYFIHLSFTEACLGCHRQVRSGRGEEIHVPLPPGVWSGQKLKLEKQGQPGLNGGVAGDVFLDILVDKHPVFRREGRNICADLPISIDEAVLGATVTVPLLEGTAELELPQNASTGRILSLTGKGIPASKLRRAGDMIFRLVVMLPEKPKPSLEQAMKAWAKKDSYQVRDTMFKSIDSLDE